MVHNSLTHMSGNWCYYWPGHLPCVVSHGLSSAGSTGFLTWWAQAAFQDSKGRSYKTLEAWAQKLHNISRTETGGKGAGNNP